MIEDKLLISNVLPQMIEHDTHAVGAFDSKGNLLQISDSAGAILEIKRNGTFCFAKTRHVSESTKQLFLSFLNGDESESRMVFEFSNKSKLVSLKKLTLRKDGNEIKILFFEEDIIRTSQLEQDLNQSILDSLDDAVLVVDKLGNIINVNDKIVNYLRNQRRYAVAISKSFYDFFEEFPSKSILDENLKSVLSGKQNGFDHELRLGDNKWYNFTITKLKEPFGAVITWRDINTRKEIELALENSLVKYRNTYNKAPVMMHSSDKNFVITSVSDFWLEKMQYDRNEVIGREESYFLDESSRVDYLGFLKEKGTSDRLRTIEVRMRKKNGAVMDVLWSVNVEYDKGGSFSRYLSGIIDVTELKNKEKELEKSQRNLLESQRISKIGNFELDIFNGKIHASKELDVILGIDVNDTSIDLLNRLVLDEDQSEYMQKLVGSLSNERDFYHTYRITHHKTNGIKWVSTRGKIVASSQDNRKKLIGTIQDITEQKEAEDKIRLLTDRVLLATEIANIGIWEYQKETAQIIWEEQMYVIFDRKKPIQSLRDLSVIVHPDDKIQFDQFSSNMLTGTSFLEYDFRIIVEKQVKHVRTFTRIVRHPNGRIKNILGVVYDVTSDKKAQQELTNSLAEKDILIKEVHHRVKNNFQLVSSILALKSFSIKDEDSKKTFAEISERIKAMSLIHDRLYTFYNLSEIEIEEYLTHISNGLRSLHGSERIELEVKADKAVFNVDKALLIGLIISELVSNAVKHGFSSMDKGHIRITFFNKADSYQLMVWNDGSPIPADTLTSSSGLGLSLIRTFVRQLHGTVDIVSDNTFKIDF